jgi:hypothetical protein
MVKLHGQKTAYEFEVAEVIALVLLFDAVLQQSHVSQRRHGRIGSAWIDSTRDNLGQSERGVHDAGVADENVKGGMDVGSSKGRHRRQVLHKNKTRLLTTVNQTDFLMENRCNLKQMIGVVTFRSIMPKVTSPE